MFSFSKTRRFDLGRYPAGRSKSVRFDRAGIVRVFCEIHSHMSAFIIVFAHRFFAVTDGAGRYEIADVPPGGYTIVAWTAGQVRERRELEVAPGAGRCAGGLRRRMSRPLASLRNRIFLACLVVSLLSIGVTSRFVTTRVTSQADTDLRSDVANAAELLERQYRARLDEMGLIAELIADLPRLKAAVATGDVATVVPIARDYQERAAADLFVVRGCGRRGAGRAGRRAADAAAAPSPHGARTRPGRLGRRHVAGGRRAHHDRTRPR